VDSTGALLHAGDHAGTPRRGTEGSDALEPTRGSDAPRRTLRAPGPSGGIGGLRCAPGRRVRCRRRHVRPRSPGSRRPTQVRRELTSRSAAVLPGPFSRSRGPCGSPGARERLQERDKGPYNARHALSPGAGQRSWSGPPAPGSLQGSPEREVRPRGRRGPETPWPRAAGALRHRGPRRRGGRLVEATRNTRAPPAPGSTHTHEGPSRVREGPSVERARLSSAGRSAPRSTRRGGHRW
jgi:hypothetical protein